MRNSNGYAPNYTKACIALFGVNLSWMLIAVWAVWGLFAVAAMAWAVHFVIGYIETRRG
ncbi:MAG: hypothetical protein ABJJ53_01155 [Sulfitobacter sp.]